MTRTRWILVALLLLVGCATGLVISAQSLPITKSLQWSPNPDSDGISTYTVQLDTNPTTSVSPATCSATLCSTPIVFSSAGMHTVIVTAINMWGSGSASLTVNIVVPGKPTGLKIQ